MKIAIIAHTNAPWTEPYARYFLEQGHQVRVISFHPDQLDGVSCDFVGRAPFQPDKNKLLFVSRVPVVRQILRIFAPDVVLACYVISNGLTAALAWDGPLVISARGGGIMRQTRTGEPGPPTPLRRRILQFILRRATLVHAVSNEIAETAESLGIPRERVRVFPLGADLNRCQFHEPPAPNGDEIQIVCTRRHDRIYENHVLVDALQLVRDAGGAFRCTFVGGGPLLAERQQQVHALGLAEHVRITGPVAPQDVPIFLASADIYVSASRGDGTSSSLLEAMACGAFPIVTNIRANRDWIEDRHNGLLFDVGYSSQLANSIRVAMSNWPMRIRAAESNRRLVAEKGNRRTCNRQMLELLRLATESPSPTDSQAGGTS